MTEAQERVCASCGNSDEVVRLETCGVDRRFFCADCAHRAAHGRRFCSPDCARAYYFSGESDDDEDVSTDDD